MEMFGVEFFLVIGQRSVIEALALAGQIISQLVLIDLLVCMVEFG